MSRISKRHIAAASLVVLLGIGLAAGVIGLLSAIARHDNSADAAFDAHVSSEEAVASQEPPTIASPASGVTTPARPATFAGRVVVRCQGTYNAEEPESTPSAQFALVPDEVTGAVDFSKVWASKLSNCSSANSPVSPSGPVETTAYNTAGYTDGNISALFEICASVSPDDVYLRSNFLMSKDQAKEVSGALVLCPNHPHAPTWQQDISLASSGNAFRDGTYRVGSEVHAGTYAIDAAVDGCYWERQDSSGGIIQNRFIDHADRVQVTIAGSDFSFTSRNCGVWKAVN